MNQLYWFSTDWMVALRDELDIQREFLDVEFEEDLLGFGFTLEKGKKFKERYGQAIYDMDVLHLVKLGQIDAQVMGSAIYYRWYYYKYVADSSYDIFWDENLGWFFQAFHILQELSLIPDDIVMGEIAEFRLVTDIRSLGAAYNKGNVLVQELMVMDDSEIRVIDHVFVGIELMEALEYSYSLSTQKMKLLLNEVKDFLNVGFLKGGTEHNGSWELELVEADGKKLFLEGSIYDRFNGFGYVDGVLKGLIKHKDIFGFSAMRDSMIKRIDFSLSNDDGYHESFVVDIEKDTIEAHRYDGTVIRAVIEGFKHFNSTYDLLNDIEGYGLTDNKANHEQYIMSVTYETGAVRYITGNYNKESLPIAWPLLMEDIMLNMPEFKSTYMGREKNYGRRIGRGVE